jgi:hypothetical protein
MGSDAPVPAPKRGEDHKAYTERIINDYLAQEIPKAQAQGVDFANLQKVVSGVPGLEKVAPVAGALGQAREAGIAEKLTGVAGAKARAVPAEQGPQPEGVTQPGLQAPLAPGMAMQEVPRAGTEEEAQRRLMAEGGLAEFGVSTEKTPQYTEALGLPTRAEVFKEKEAVLKREQAEIDRVNKAVKESRAAGSKVNETLFKEINDSIPNVAKRLNDAEDILIKLEEQKTFGEEVSATKMRQAKRNVQRLEATLKAAEAESDRIGQILGKRPTFKTEADIPVSDRVKRTVENAEAEAAKSGISAEDWVMKMSTLSDAEKQEALRYMGGESVSTSVAGDVETLARQQAIANLKASNPSATPEEIEKYLETAEGKSLLQRAIAGFKTRRGG